MRGRPRKTGQRGSGTPVVTPTGLIVNIKSAPDAEVGKIQLEVISDSATNCKAISVTKPTDMSLSVIRTESAPQTISITNRPVITTPATENLESLDSDDEKTEEQLCQEAELDMLHSQLPGNSLNTKLNSMIRKQVVKEKKSAKKEEIAIKKEIARKTDMNRINQIIGYHNSEILEKTEDARWMEENKGLDWGLRMKDLLPACKIELEYDDKFMEEHKCEIIVFDAYLRDPKGFVNSSYAKGKSPEEIQRIINDALEYQHIL